MISTENEVIDFKNVIDPIGKQVEDWMREVENQMKITVKHELFKSLQSYKEN